MRADLDPCRRRQDPPLVAGEVEPDAVGAGLGPHRVPHPLEVAEGPWGEPVAPCRLDVHLVEGRQVGRLSERHLDPGLLGFADVASPQLVEAAEHLIE